MEDLQTRKKNLIMFPLGTVGRDMLYSLFTNFILTFVLFTRNLTAAQLAAVTGIIVGARIFDALNDPIMGNIIERTRTRWGKFKPWMLIGVLSTSVVVYLAFNTDLQGWNFIWFFGAIYFLYSITYTMHDISYWGMVPALSSDPDARNQFTSRTNLFAGIGGTLASILIPIFTTGEHAIGGSATIAYGRIALVVCILMPLFICFTLFGVRERRDDMEKPAPPVSFKKIIGTIFSNDQLLWISLAFLLQQIGNDIIIGGLGSTYIYFDFGYNGGLYSIFTTVGMSATALLMIFYPAISRKIDRKPLMKKLAICAVIGYAIMILPGIFMESTMLKFWLIVVGYLLSNLGQYGFYLIMMISIMNTVEYNEYKFGVRDEAIIGSLRPFLTKLASALVVVITSSSYMLFGVTNFTNKISDFENQAARNLISDADKLNGITDVLRGVTHGQSLGLLLCMTVLPCIMLLASYIIYKRKFILDEDEYERICKELEARK